MTREEKLERISAFETSYSRVDELIAGMDREELLFVPTIRDAWSVNDFLVHFLDADVSLAFRVRTAIAEPGKAVPVWEEEAWHDFLRYEDEDGPSCLGLAKGIRSYLAVSLRSVVDADWSSFSIMHPAKGMLGLAELLEMYDEHIVFHLPLIKRNRRAWRERGML
jgi:hypothetical protein